MTCRSIFCRTWSFGGTHVKIIFKQLLFFSEIATESEVFWSNRFKDALRQMRAKVSEVPSAEKISAPVDSDATVLFDATKLEIAHADETPDNSSLPAATDNEDHVASLSHSILETSVRSELSTITNSLFLFLNNRWYKIVPLCKPLHKMGSKSSYMESLAIKFMQAKLSQALKAFSQKILCGRIVFHLSSALGLKKRPYIFIVVSRQCLFS